MTIASTLPISRLVSVNVNLTQSGAQMQNISNLLVLGSSDAIDVVSRMRSYLSASAVATDFGTTAPEYLAAAAWFGQSPQPTSLSIGRWAKTASVGGLYGATLSSAQQLLATWTAITTGSFKLAINGAAAADITGLNFLRRS